MLKAIQNRIIKETTPLKRLDRSTSLDIFNGMSEEEIKYSVSNMCVLSPQRGCRQCCNGCHAGASKEVSQVSWKNFQKTIDGIETAINQLGAYILSPFIEVFRDSDPGHLSFSDKPGYGIGKMAQEIYERLNKKVKVMTSGAPDETLLTQLVEGLPYYYSVSVSLSIETKSYRQNYIENIFKLARNLDALIKNADSETPIYADILFYSDTGEDLRTQKTLKLLRDVLEVSRYFPKDLLVQLLDSKIDGSKNNKFMTTHGKKIGLRISPYLNLDTEGRGLIKGQSIKEVGISDILGINHGYNKDTFSVNNHSFTREELTYNLKSRNTFISLLKNNVTNEGILKNNIKKLDKLFKTEFSIAPTSMIYSKSGNKSRRPTINFLVSNPDGNEIQEVLPWKPLNI